MAKDRYIYGLKDAKIRSYLLTNNDGDVNTAAKVLALAIEKESALTANTTMSGVSAHFVKKIQQSGKSHQKQKQLYHPVDKAGDRCAKCTLRGHKAADCKVVCRFARKWDISKQTALREKNRTILSLDSEQNADFGTSSKLGPHFMFSVKLPGTKQHRRFCRRQNGKTSKRQE